MAVSQRTVASNVGNSLLRGSVKGIRQAVNVLLIAIILYAARALRAPKAIRGDKNLRLPNRIKAQEQARRLDAKYLPSLETSSSSDIHAGYNQHPPSQHSATLVMGRLHNETERVQWAFDDLANIQDYQIYIVDDAKSKLPHLERNHGREAAVYLTYIVNNYDRLNDVTFFWHPDKTVWHNNILLNWDSVQTINRMDRRSIIRQGYVGSRCDHWPGCPDWIKFNPSKAEHRLDPHRLEEMFNPSLFKTLFPNNTDFAPYFAGTCCSQFAVSRETIRQNSLEAYKVLLKWILDYQDDERSGMLFEYIWPYIFLGRGSLCPGMEECYCKNYNICLQKNDLDQLEFWNAMRTRREEIKWQVTLVEDAIANRKLDLKDQGAGKEEKSNVLKAYKPELERLKADLDRLAEKTWNLREQIIHRWRLGVPPVGW